MTDGDAGPLEVRTFTGGPFVENGYLLRCRATGEAAVVDPGFAATGMAAAIRDEDLSVVAVYLTHAHLDHVEGIPRIREVTDAPIWLHPADRPLYDRAADQAAAFGLRLPGPLPAPDRELVPGTTVPVGNVEMEVLFTPGHAPGHVMFHVPDAGLALAGDVVFAGSIGRTDLPGGDFQQLMDSIREQVLTLPDETRLLTGHGPETTVGRERRGNPFLAPNFGGELV
jgi:hydroxyacylglutathione hydrolase